MTRTMERDTHGRYAVAINIPREPDGTFPAYAWPGGYPIIYMTRDGLTVCPQCASDPDTSDPVVAGQVYWEGPDMYCEDGSSCRTMTGPSIIPSAYGDPDTDGAS